MAKAREKDAEAALDAKIRRIKEENRLREQRKQEVEADRQLARAAGSDEARISKCVRYQRSPSPEDEPRDGGRHAPSGRGRDSREGAGFLRDRARDCPERGAPGARAERGRPAPPVRREDAAWRQERQQIDQRRVERARDSNGGWRREWDREKEHVDALRDSQGARRGGAAPGGEGRGRRARSPTGGDTGVGPRRAAVAVRRPGDSAALPGQPAAAGGDDGGAQRRPSAETSGADGRRRRGRRGRGRGREPPAAQSAGHHDQPAAQEDPAAQGHSAASPPAVRPPAPRTGPAEVRVTGPASRRAAAFSARLRAEQLAAEQQQQQQQDQQSEQQFADGEPDDRLIDSRETEEPLHRQFSTEESVGGDYDYDDDSRGSQEGWRCTDISPEELMAAESQNGELGEPGARFSHQDSPQNAAARPRSVSPISALLGGVSGREPPCSPPAPAPGPLSPPQCDPSAVLAVARNLSQLGVQGAAAPLYAAQPQARYDALPPPQSQPQPQVQPQPQSQHYGGPAVHGAAQSSAYGVPTQVPPAAYGSAHGMTGYQGGSPAFSGPPSRGAAVAPQGSAQQQPPVSYCSPPQGVPMYGAAIQAPPLAYGSPQGAPLSYGSPQGPPLLYGSPQGPPPSYGSPQGPPAAYGSTQPYGAPSQDPRMVYGQLPPTCQHGPVPAAAGAVVSTQSPAAHEQYVAPPVRAPAAGGPCDGPAAAIPVSPAGVYARPPQPATLTPEQPQQHLQLAQQQGVQQVQQSASQLQQPMARLQQPQQPVTQMQQPVTQQLQQPAAQGLQQQQQSVVSHQQPPAATQQSSASVAASPSVAGERPAPSVYVPPGRRALLGRRHSPPPPQTPPAPTRRQGPIQCVTYVDGKPVEGPVDDSMFTIQDVRLKDGML